MIEFKDLFINNSGKLVISAKISEEDYFDDMIIESLQIDTQNTYSPNGVSNSPKYSKTFSYNLETASGIYDSRNLKIILSPKELSIENFENNILFVYIGTSGVPSPKTPCGKDNKYTLGIAYSKKPFISPIIKDLGESAEEVPNSIIENILRLRAFEVAIETGNIVTAIKMWKKVNSRINIQKSNCGCNGTSK